MIDKDMIGWMQAQWRDCADREAQMRIFRDMTRAPVEEICAALGEDPAPWIKAKKTYRKWTPEDDAELARMVGESVPAGQIAEALGRQVRAGNCRIAQLKLRMPPAEPEPVGDAQEPEPGKTEKKEKKRARNPGGWDKAAEEEILALLEYEERILTELEVVRGQIAQRRERLAELLSIAGGVLRDDEK